MDDIIDGFTLKEIMAMEFDGVATAICTKCGAEHRVEPDARGYDCDECGAKGSVTSPIEKAMSVVF